VTDHNTGAGEPITVNLRIQHNAPHGNKLVEAAARLLAQQLPEGHVHLSTPDGAWLGCWQPNGGQQPADPDEQPADPPRLWSVIMHDRTERHGLTAAQVDIVVLADLLSDMPMIRTIHRDRSSHWFGLDDWAEARGLDRCASNATRNAAAW
jgi:hypothetical protein